MKWHNWWGIQCALAILCFSFYHATALKSAAVKRRTYTHTHTKIQTHTKTFPHSAKRNQALFPNSSQAVTTPLSLSDGSQSSEAPLSGPLSPFTLKLTNTWQIPIYVSSLSLSCADYRSSLSPRPPLQRFPGSHLRVSTHSPSHCLPLLPLTCCTPALSADFILLHSSTFLPLALGLAPCLFSHPLSAFVFLKSEIS